MEQRIWKIGLFFLFAAVIIGAVYNDTNEGIVNYTGEATSFVPDLSETDKVTSSVQDLNELSRGHNCDILDPYCLDALDIIPPPSEVSTRGTSEIDNEKLKKAFENAQKRVEKTTGKSFPKSDVSTRILSDNEKEYFSDVIISIDYYNYEKKYGVNPLKKSAVTTRATSPPKINFVWDEKAFKKNRGEAKGLDSATLNQLKVYTKCIYDHYIQINGNPISLSGDRTVFIKPKLDDECGGPSDACYSSLFDTIYLSSSGGSVSYSTLSHEMSHVWRGQKVFSILGSRQVEEGLASFNEKEFMNWVSTLPKTNKCYLDYINKPSYFDWNSHNLIYSTFYDGPLNYNYVVHSFVNKKYLAGRVLIAKLYLVNNHFLIKLHNILRSTSVEIESNQKIKNILIEAVGKDKIIDGQYAKAFINNLPLLRGIATPGNYVSPDGNRLVKKDKDGFVDYAFTTPTLLSGKFYNSFGWPENIDYSVGRYPSIVLTTYPSTPYGYGRYQYDIKGYKTDYLIGFTHPVEIRHPDGVTYITINNVDTVFYFDEFNEFIANNDLELIGDEYSLLGIVDTTGDLKAKEVSFYCNKKLIETKNMEVSSSKLKILFSKSGCVGNADVKVKVTNLSDEYREYYTSLTIDGGHIFNFDPLDSRWKKISPISYIKQSRIDSKFVSLTFFTSHPAVVYLKCRVPGSISPNKILGSWTINKKSDSTVKVKVGTRYQKCQFETERQVYDGKETIKSSEFILK